MQVLFKEVCSETKSNKTFAFAHWRKTIPMFSLQDKIYIQQFSVTSYESSKSQIESHGSYGSPSAPVKSSDSYGSPTAPIETYKGSEVSDKSNMKTPENSSFY